MTLSIIILAAGQGTRMYSDKPKVLHTLAGRPLLAHVYQTAVALTHREIHIVYGHGGEQVPETLQDFQASWVKQEEQLGTGHAVQQVFPNLPDVDNILILYGDVPLITEESLTILVDAASDSGFSLLTTHLDNPRGYGRIIRDEHENIVAIVEEKDATEEQRKICEVNTGFMVIKGKQLKLWVNALKNENKQNEYYLTDIVKLAVSDGVNVAPVIADSPIEVQGINTRIQLSEAERYYQLVQAHHLMRNGVGLIDPARFDLRGDLEIGRDNEIDINVVIEGRVKLGNNVTIGANCYLKDTIIADNVIVLPNTMIDSAVIGNGCRIGPFARIRPDTTLDENVHIGNFVELKKTDVGKGSKVNHLTYLGDSHVGMGTNIGAGTITCNYDGVNKHQTIIGDDVFIGSDVQLIAPVKINNGATIAAGATITKDVSENELAISRVEQKSISKWKRPTKK
ncbi:MAG TPA: UDP-N-acetylglucosamine diphosphorylase/glucosamine-1-phosphate N-acetyltransferase [Thiotrichaceae bacterium]|jgi:bifunctional UDP-N-acetylglucosamine pyrophosphorylase/glucosamine-1-phosphate N-acetyltransferase|nr:UDP-N-acetylglucosamine diphosphorylase/glucosamine-1-phosphate N-acetyltransferase [Thiotrichaceae bacterium]HIM07330.1 UDP-N-acetylglucosamine diphosphorylase/glucosamine-1-phosphate N-acetyltransferase [Gammaproteobacteria bacterium]